MKKLALVAIISSLTMLTACSKPATEVKKEQSAASQATSASTAVDTTAASTAAPSSEAAPTTVVAGVSKNNKADIQSDIQQLENFDKMQQVKAAPLEKRMQDATAKKDQAALKKVFADYKVFVGESNAAIQNLHLKSQEVTDYRAKVIDMTNIGLQLGELSMSASGAPTAADKAKAEKLQQQGMQLQQEITVIAQDIQKKLGIKPPVATESAEQAPNVTAKKAS